MAIASPAQEIEREHLQADRFRELFDNQPIDGDIDVSCYIKKATNNNVFVGWRVFAGKPQEDWRLHKS